MSAAIRLIICVLLVATTSSLRASPTEATVPALMEEALILRVDGKLTIDPQGMTTDYQIKTELPQKLRDSLQRQVRSWRFKPVLVAGKPVVAQTQMRVTLAAIGKGDDSRITVDNVTFPQMGVQPSDASDAPDPVGISYADQLRIDYPDWALKYDLEVYLLVELQLSLEGHVEKAFVAQTALCDVKGKPAVLNDAVEAFSRHVLAASKRWRFNVDVHVPAPTPEDLTVRVPVHFAVLGTPGARSDRTGWQLEVRTPFRTAPWLLPDPNVQHIGVADLGSGELGWGNPRFQLSAPVAGSVL